MYQEREALEYRSENDNYEKVKKNFRIKFPMKFVWGFLNNSAMFSMRKYVMLKFDNWHFVIWNFRVSIGIDLVRSLCNFTFTS